MLRKINLNFNEPIDEELMYELKHTTPDFEIFNILAAMFDGKHIDTLPKYVSISSRKKAEEYNYTQALYLVTLNWDEFSNIKNHKLKNK